MPNSKSDWKRVQGMSEEETLRRAEDDPENPPLTDEEMRRLKPMRLEDFLPRPKEQISVRVDADVLKWLRSQGPGYQTKINAVLRAYMEQKQTRLRR